jgi:uncharacterized protein YndB with AHSA1/START domain/DNA-binding transcriptional ArsR family regulator
MADQLSRVFAALADPTRRDLVRRLAAADATVNELARPYGVSLQAISKHLKVLEDAGLVTKGRKAQTRPVHLEAEVFDPDDRVDRALPASGGAALSASGRGASWAQGLRRRPARCRDRGRKGIMTTKNEATIVADEKLPIIRITRDFDATPAQLMRAHLDPDLFARWVGPDGAETRIDVWDVRDGGSWRYVGGLHGQEYAFRGCFHRVGVDAIVQTFTWEEMPEDVSLETLRFEDLGNGRTRLHAQSLVDSFESRDAWLRSGMEVGVNDGYAKLDGLLSAGAIR